MLLGWDGVGVWLFIIPLVSGIIRQYVPFLVLTIISTTVLIFSSNLRSALLIACASGAFFAYGLISSENYLSGKEQFQFLTWQSRGEKDLLLKGWVSSYPMENRGRNEFAFRTNVQGKELTLFVKTTLPAVDYGMELAIRRWRYAKRSLDKDYFEDIEIKAGRTIAAQIKVKPSDVSLLEGSKGSLIKRKFLFPTRKKLRNSILISLGKDGAYPLALFLGERSYIERKDRKLITKLGINHLFALSGFHLGIIVGVVLLVCRMCRLRSRMIVLLVLSIYVGLIGDLKSLQRAYTMVALSMLATGSQRFIKPLDVLESSMLLLLLFDPFSIFSLSFQLSFTATFGIILCFSKISSQKNIKSLPKAAKYLLVSTLVSISAQLFTTPIILLHFGKISLFTPITTLIFMPFVALILIATGLSAIAFFLCPCLSCSGFWILSHLVSLMESLVEKAGSMVPDPIMLKAPIFLLYYSGLLLFFVGHGYRSKALAIVLMISSFILQRESPGIGLAWNFLKF